MRNLLLLSVILIFVQNIFAQTPGTLKWAFQTDDQIKSSPAIGTNGTIYMNPGNDKLYALNSEGALQWIFQTEFYNWEGSTPVIGNDGTIYLCSGDGKLYAINPDGTKKWEFQGSESGGTSSPVAGADGTVYFISDKLFAVLSDGNKKWELNISCGTNDPLAIGPDGTIYVVSACGNIFNAVTPDGKIKWKFKPEPYYLFHSSPAIGNDGTIYISKFALNPDGTKKWIQTDASSSSSPAIGVDGTIYLGSSALNPNGTIKWKIEMVDVFRSSPAIGSDGTIYVGSKDSSFYAINPDGTEKWTFKTEGCIYSSPAIGSDGIVYFGSNDGKLYAVYSESFGLAESQWPKFKKNNQNAANGFTENCPQAIVSENFISTKDGGKITLDGSASFDPDREPLSYLWRIAEKTPGCPDVLADSTSAIITVNIPQGLHGTYRFALTVTDNDDGYSSASVEVSTQKKWEFQTGGYITSSPAIGPDGCVYISSGCNDYQGKLHVLNPDGSLKWEFQATGNNYVNTPVINSNGTIYVSADSSEGWDIFGRLYAINKFGLKEWAFTGDSIVFTNPAIASDGTIYISTRWYNSDLYAINPDGIPKWISENSSGGLQVIASDGTIYTSGSELTATNPDGTIKWQYDTLGTFTEPAIGSNGTIYVISSFSDCYEGNCKYLTILHAINPDGTIIWKFVTDKTSIICSSPVIGYDGTVYAGLDKFYAFNPNGTKKWEFAPDSLSGFIGLAAIGSDGTIYCNHENHKFYAINPDGTKKWEIINYTYSAPAIADDGTIYLASGEGCLYALYSDSKGLADSPWPKFRHDNRNTGNVETPTPVEETKPEIPKKYTLFPMYPNPFNPATHVKFSLPKAGKVQINVYNILGQKVAKLLDAKKAAGVYDISWNASRLSSGMYFIRFESADYVKVRKCLLIK